MKTKVIAIISRINDNRMRYLITKIHYYDCYIEAEGISKQTKRLWLYVVNGPWWRANKMMIEFLDKEEEIIYKLVEEDL